jgi:hypothetical protein
MDARKVQLKFFVESPKTVHIEPLVPVFHSWIKHKSLDDLLIDVTEYEHVHDGPALLLVGHESDYYVDFGGGRAGLLYSRKRGGPTDAAVCVLDAFRRALTACKKLEDEKLDTPLAFRTGEVLFRLNDRLLAPNKKETFDGVAPVLRDVLAKVYPGTTATLEALPPSRDLFSVRVRIPGAPSVTDVLRRIS